MVTAFGRIGGWVVGFVANNSAVASGQIDVDAARKATRFIRFCNLYNIPMLFLEDVTGFLPGSDQESRGIILEGRRLLDAIVDLRVPRMTLIIRNAFGGAYAAYNSHFTGADVVFAMPMSRIAVMGPAAAPRSGSRTGSARSNRGCRRPRPAACPRPERGASTAG